MSFIDFEGNNFTLITDENKEPWMIAKEICDFLEIKHVPSALKRVADEEKKYMVFDHLKSRGHGRGGDNGKRTIVTEAGIYQLIFLSRKPEARKFQRWLYRDVLPSLRKTGEYKMQEKIEEPAKPATTVIVDSPNYMDMVPANMYEALRYAADKELENMQLIAALEEETQEKVKAVNSLRVAERSVAQATKIVTKVGWKAKGWDELYNLTGYYSLTAGAKLIGLAPRKFINDLKRDGYLYKRGHQRNNLAMQRYIDLGWFVVKKVPSKSNPEKGFLQTMVTAKGLRVFFKIYGPKQQTLLPDPEGDD